MSHPNPRLMFFYLGPMVSEDHKQQDEVARVLFQIFNIVTTITVTSFIGQLFLNWSDQHAMVNFYSPKLSKNLC